MKRPEPELFLDDHRGHYIARDFAECINRERLLGVCDEDLAILAAYDGPCVCVARLADQPDDDRTIDESCDVCGGTGETTSEIVDETFADICDHALVMIECDWPEIPRDPGAREVFLDAVREGRDDDARRILDAGERTSLSGMATVRSDASNPERSCIAWPKGDVQCLRDLMELQDNPLNIVVGRFEMREGALWIIPEGMDYDERTDSYFWAQPMVIKVENSDDLDDETPMVTIYCDDQRQARLDQSIEGSRWECPGDMDIAYASAIDYPGLIAALRADGYEVDDSNYSPPDPHCETCGSSPLACAAMRDQPDSASYRCHNPSS